MEKDAQAVVVGSSAVGGILAKHLAKSGVDTLVLEEHAKPGKFHKCSGIMSKAGLESLSVDIKPVTLNEVRGARIFAGGSELKIEAASTKGVVIDRQAYDERCALEAQEAGAKLVLNARVDSIVKNGFGYEVRAAGERYSCRAVAGCDGASSFVARQFNFPKIETADFVSAWEGEFHGAFVPEPHLVHIYLGPSLYKGFFGWLIPAGGDVVRVGFASSDFASIRESKNRFIKSPWVAEAIGDAVPGCECVRQFNYVIPLRPRARTQDAGVVLCGDAAGQVKATTGGGVVFGGKCAIEAASQLKSFVQGGKLDYERVWREKYGDVLSAHVLIRKAYNAIEASGGDSVLSLGLTAGRALGFENLLAKKGDMDFIVN